MKKILTIAAAALIMASCSNEKFHVSGNITNAADSVLYLENVGISELQVIDSVKLDADGSFDFSAAATTAPEFYRLRIADQIVNIVIDSTETVSVKASWPDMARNYEVSGSDDNLKVKELALKQMALQQRAIAVSRDQQLSIDQSNDSIIGMVKRYKEEVKRDYIFPHPERPYAYFALFQTLGNMLMFNPRTDKDDIKVFAAVATSWDTYYPDAERGANLHNIAIEGMKYVRLAEARQSARIDADKVHTAGVIDIELTDNRGQERRLTDLKGQVVLLDFHVFGLKESPARILMLRELYNKYHAQGLEIFQVSLDTDEHFWKQQTSALPWISLHEPQGINSPTLRMYNVQSLPEYFLIDRGNNLVGRSQQISDIDAAIKKLL
ncbi:MAG: AhpC/TSA family protein [Prevotella sp.]|nr:AhpC/TSA family protein [Prevotella sp.]